MMKITMMMMSTAVVSVNGMFTKKVKAPKAPKMTYSEQEKAFKAENKKAIKKQKLSELQRSKVDMVEKKRLVRRNQSSDSESDDDSKKSSSFVQSDKAYEQMRAAFDAQNPGAAAERERKEAQIRTSHMVKKEGSFVQVASDQSTKDIPNPTPKQTVEIRQNVMFPHKYKKKNQSSFVQVASDKSSGTDDSSDDETDVENMTADQRKKLGKKTMFSYKNKKPVPKAKATKTKAVEDMTSPERKALGRKTMFSYKK